jgi:hypothetical protein
MLLRSLIGAVALALLGVGAAVAQGSGQPGSGQPAFDQSKYPDWKGQWLRTGRGNGNAWDPSKPIGLGEQAPLTPEYQAIYEAALKDEAAGGQGSDPTYLCVPSGMPRGMIAVLPMEIIITPETTYVALELFNMRRRIYTDGRDFPADLKPSFSGYSIGHWEDSKGTGRSDQLVVATRGLKGPHTYDSSGVPFHPDDQAVITERLYSDRDDPNILHDEVTTIDHALTRPWTVTRSYHRDARPQPLWTETYCTEDNHHVFIGGHNYIISGDGHLMPARKDQPPPDLRNFQAGN